VKAATVCAGFFTGIFSLFPLRKTCSLENAHLSSVWLQRDTYAEAPHSFFGQAMMKGNKTVEQTIKLGKLKDTPKGMVVAYNYTLLSD